MGPVTDDADELYEAFTTWADGQGLALYPHQDEAIIEVLSGRHVVLATPTGSGKSLVATAAHFAALAADRVSFYTAPIKALVNEKFFALCDVFGADQVGLLTGDASVNADAPIICCTAEVLANIALREGSSADVGLVVMDEFHYYADPQRGWAWQVPLLELTDTQLVLMSATLGDMSGISDDLTQRTGRDVALVITAERPVPLTFSWSVDPLTDTLEEIVSTHRAPVYVVHPSQAAAAEHAKSLHSMKLLTPQEKVAIADRLATVRFAAGFGKTLNGLLRKGIGVHHAGMLPRYRRTVEQLAQAGLLKVICGTDTLGVGINVPIRTVLFTQLAKFDGTKERILKAREFHQIAGRAGRAGYDTSGEVVVHNAATLTVAAGVTVKFTSGSALIIGYYVYDQGQVNSTERGKLVVNGTAAQRVVFTAQNGLSGGWKGLAFGNATDFAGLTSSMSYLTVEKGGQPQTLNGSVPAVSANIMMFTTGVGFTWTGVEANGGAGFGFYVSSSTFNAT
ncbi:MAG TPA: DEAD/DEAH box helicase, partial [Phycicoccus sp.]|nr:DEAD/DEAH box helicase [Phycicoccus sp.]